MPNHRKPNEQKRRLGNPGKRPMPSPLAVVPSIVEEHDSWLTSSPSAAFDRLVEEGTGWLAKTDAVALAMMRSVLAEIDDLQELVSAEPTNMDRRRALREAWKVAVSLLGPLGFTPADRSRLGLTEVKAMSKLEEIRARQNRPTRATKVADEDHAD